VGAVCCCGSGGSNTNPVSIGPSPFPTFAEETPYSGGVFHVKLILSHDFPSSPPRGFFLTKIFHPNVSSNGDICVNTLNKDWNADMTLIHILQVIPYAQ